jgi:1,4-dihydroxy-2-naphthoyl-CoA hydrolase
MTSSPLRQIGLSIDEVAYGRVVGHFEPSSHHGDRSGLVHGGVWSIVAESLASWGAALCAEPPGSAVVGVNNTTDRLRPHTLGRVDAVATAVFMGPDQLWEVLITCNAYGVPLARSTVRLQSIASLPTRRGGSGADA